MLCPLSPSLSLSLSLSPKINNLKKNQNEKDNHKEEKIQDGTVFIEKKSVCMGTPTVQTHLVQGSNVYLYDVSTKSLLELIIAPH